MQGAFDECLPPGGERRMARQILIFIADENSPDSGEIKLVDDIRQAERFIETMLEAGFEQKGLRIFHASEVIMQISYRPVVSLGKDGRPVAGSDEAGEAVPPSEGALDGEPAGEPDTEGKPMVQQGVRFSSLFKQS
jgi:hypothetical protein